MKNEIALPDEIAKDLHSNMKVSSTFEKTISNRGKTLNFIRNVKHNLKSNIRNEIHEQKSDKNIFKKIKLIKEKGENIWEEKLKNIIDINKKLNIRKRTLNKKIIRKNLSYTPKNIKRKKVNEERDIFDCLRINTKKGSKDFSSVTNSINYLLDKNKMLLKNEKKFNIKSFNFIFKPNRKSDKIRNIFKTKNFFSRNGMYGKKNNLPLFYEFSLTHRNYYSSKSDKNRHEFLLNELHKLKFYLENNPNKELLIIKDFLQKFHIKNIEKYSEEKLLYLSNLICKSKENKLVNLIKTDSNIKKMIYNLLDNSFELNQNPKNNYILERNNSIYNKYPNNENKHILKKNKTYYNLRVNKRKKYFDINETNSKLKYIEHQKKVHIPNKNYSENFNSLINDMSKEIKEIEQKIKKELEHENPVKKDVLFITQVKRIPLSSKNINNKKLILSPINIKKRGKILEIPRSKSTASIVNNKSEIFNLCLNNKKKKNKIVYLKENQLIKDKMHLKDIVQRLYYSQTQKKFGLSDIKRNLKLTEYVAFNFAKKKLYWNIIDRVLKSNLEAKNIFYK